MYLDLKSNVNEDNETDDENDVDSEVTDDVIKVSDVSEEESDEDLCGTIILINLYILFLRI